MCYMNPYVYIHISLKGIPYNLEVISKIEVYIPEMFASLCVYRTEICFPQYFPQLNI